MNAHFLFLLALFVSLTGHAQDSTATRKTSRGKVSFRKQMNRLAAQQIDQLHEGALLVRLFTKEKTIAAMRKSGNSKMADRVQAEQAELNRSIIEAFRTRFDFCPVYFFYSDCSKDVRESRFENVRFLNDTLGVDSTISFNGGKFLTAEFSTVQQDTATYNYYVPGETGPRRESPYYGGPAMGFGALVIKSDQFIQLRRPFPYYVRTYDSLPVRRRPKTVVAKMNRELHQFYGSGKTVPPGRDQAKQTP